MTNAEFVEYARQQIRLMLENCEKSGTPLNDVYALWQRQMAYLQAQFESNQAKLN